MSEQDKGDGVLIGILVVLALLVIGGVGVVGIRFVRVNQAVMLERDMAEMMRNEAERQRDAAEAARLEAEALRTQVQNQEVAKPDLTDDSVVNRDGQDAENKQP